MRRASKLFCPSSRFFSNSGAADGPVGKHSRPQFGSRASETCRLQDLLRQHRTGGFINSTARSPSLKANVKAVLICGRQVWPPGRAFLRAAICPLLQYL